MNQIASLQSIHSNIDALSLTFNDLVQKLDRILRLFRINKSYDANTASEIRIRAGNIVRQMEKIDPTFYAQVKGQIDDYVNQVLSEPPQKKNQVKNSTVSLSGKQDPKVQSFGSQSDKKEEGMLSSSKSPQNSVHQQKTNEQMKQKQPIKISTQNDRQKQKPLQNYNIDFDKKQSSAQISGSKSDPFKSNISLKEYCHINGSNIESKIVMNDEIATFLKTMSPDKVALLGVQKPHDKNVDKLYLCSYMEFSKDIVTSMKFKAKDYQNELQEFLNVIRFPFALCVIGQTVSDMRIHYVKFLLEMTSPLPLVIIYNQTAPDKGLLIRMSEKVIASVDGSNIIEMDSLDASINMKDKNKYKCTSLKEIPLVKDKCVTTKPLFRKFNHEVIENNQAIMVEKNSKMGFKNQKVQIIDIQQTDKGQKVEQGANVDADSAGGVQSEWFKYTFHAKFLSTVPNENFVYFIKQNNEINCRKKTKNIEESLQFIKSSNSICVLGYSSKFIDKRIPPQLFTMIMELGDKCPLVMIRIKSLTLNKVALVSLQPGTLQDTLNNTVVMYKDLEQRKFPFLNILLIGQKTQISRYQNAKSILIEI